MLLIKRSIMLVVILAALLAGCTRAPAAGTGSTTMGISLTDGLGNTVELAAPASRIISLGPSNTEILYAIDAQSRIVGCDQHSNYPEAAKPLATIADYPVLNMESIVALEPDLVLASELIPAEQVQTMRELGLKVYWLPNPKSLPGGLFENIRTVGALTGANEKAEQLVEDLQKRVDAVRQKVASAKTTPLVYYELDGTDPARPWTAGPGSGGFVDMLLNLAGSRNVGSVFQTAWTQISAEEILRQDPDIILLGDAAYGVTPESVAGRPGWGELAAVKNGAVFPINGDLTTRPGPRLIEGLEEMLHLIHPELF